MIFQDSFFHFFSSSLCMCVIIFPRLFHSIFTFFLLILFSVSFFSVLVSIYFPVFFFNSCILFCRCLLFFFYLSCTSFYLSSLYLSACLSAFLSFFGIRISILFFSFLSVCLLFQSFSQSFSQCFYSVFLSVSFYSGFFSVFHSVFLSNFFYSVSF